LDVLIEKYKEGTRRFEASNGTWGDPAPGVGKNLEIKWEFNGKTETKMVREHSGERIELPEGDLNPKKAVVHYDS
jgi:hypothetical protein